MIIYPPFIGETIPGFTNKTITIPFQCNPAVSIGEIKHFRLRIKDLINSDTLCELTVDTVRDKDNINYTEETNNGEVNFTFIENQTFPEIDKTKPDTEWEPTISQYYKFQLSASDDAAAAASSFYAYSQVAIGRCVSSISDLEVGIYNFTEGGILSAIEFTGYYKRVLTDEALYSYEFTLKDIRNNIIETTGVKQWNVEKDIDRKEGTTEGAYVNFMWSEPKFIVKNTLNYNFKYKIEFSITTINGMKKTIEYIFFKPIEYMSYFAGGVKARQSSEDMDNGCVSIK